MTEFEAMLIYDDAQSLRVLDALCGDLGRCRSEVLEDLGTYLVTAPKSAGLRRLLRFSGAGFEDFLHSLDELPDRARLAVPDLDLPRLELCETGPGRFALTCRSPLTGAGHVLVGILRAMADDYGALVTLDHAGAACGAERVSIVLHVSGFASGRTFDLGARTG